MTLTKKNSIIALAAIALLTISVLPANAATKAATPKPSVSTAPRAGGFGGGQTSAAFAKYTACLAKAGIKLPAFGGGRGFGGGTRPTGVRPSGAPGFGGTGGTPRPRPTLSLTPTQQKAFTACAALRPSFGGFGRGPGGGAPGAGGAGVPGGVTPNGKGGGIAPKTGTSAAYIACLNTHGLPVQTAADVAGLDAQNTKVIAAEKACAGK